MARYPFDDITEKQNCEQHQKMTNLSMKVAVGLALPSAPGQLFHCRPILAGYAHVGVDEVVKGLEGLELDIPPSEGETTQGEFTHRVFILWKEENIVFPDSAPMISTPPRPPTPQSPLTPPMDPQRESISISGASTDSTR
jgi:hypothetical protein